MLASAHFFAVLSDGSQAWKTGSDKKLVMVRVLRNDETVFLMWLHCHAQNVFFKGEFQNFKYSITKSANGREQFLFPI